MLQDAQARFDAGAEAWSRYNQRPLGRIRREVTWHNIAPYLPQAVDGQEPPRVLDAGGGSGELYLQPNRVWFRSHPREPTEARFEAWLEDLQALAGTGEGILEPLDCGQ